jgi:DNA repair protein RadC
MVSAGKLLDIEVLDHVIIGENNDRLSFYSIKEYGHAPFRTGAK